MLRVSASLGQERYAQLCALASRYDVSTAWLVRRAIEELIRREAGALESLERPSQGRSKEGRVSVNVDPRLHVQFVSLAGREGVSVSLLTARAVNELIERANQLDEKLEVVPREHGFRS